MSGDGTGRLAPLLEKEPLFFQKGFHLRPDDTAHELGHLTCPGFVS